MAKYGVGSPKFIGLQYTAVTPPAFGLIYEGAMVSQDRRHLFITRRGWQML
jgi:hypothetical protein